MAHGDGDAAWEEFAALRGQRDGGRYGRTGGAALTKAFRGYLKL